MLEIICCPTEDCLVLTKMFVCLTFTQVSLFLQALGICHLFTSDNGGGKCDCFCLSVCLSVSKITQKCLHWFGWHFACRQVSGHERTDQLLSAIWIIVQMPELDCFLRYRMHCNAEFYYVGKIPRTGIGHGYWAPIAAATCGFEASKHCCRT